MADDDILRQAVTDLAAAQTEVVRLAEVDGLVSPLPAGEPVPVASHEYLVAVERLAERAAHYQRTRSRD